LAQSTDVLPRLGGPEGPAFYMSTSMIKAQLERLLRELRPRARWHKRVTAKELAE
jgi:hypothetical protein